MLLCLVLPHIIKISDGKADGSFTFCKDFSHAALPSPSLYVASACAKQLCKNTNNLLELHGMLAGYH